MMLEVEIKSGSDHWKIANKAESPPKPKPTTHNPMIAPPEKAIFKAAFIPPRLAASAVLALALVAERMPMNPAKADNMAPPKKQTAVCQLTPKQMAMNKITVNIDKVTYSRFKKAMAPSRMYFWISIIFGSVKSAFFILFLRNTKA